MLAAAARTRRSFSKSQRHSDIPFDHSEDLSSLDSILSEYKYDTPSDGVDKVGRNNRTETYMTVAIEIAMKDTCRPNRILRSQQDVLGGSSPFQFSQIVTKNQMQRFLVKYHTSRKVDVARARLNTRLERSDCSSGSSVLRDPSGLKSSTPSLAGKIIST
jgi:hypothetical protein